MTTAFRPYDGIAKRILRDRADLLASPIAEAARRRIGHAIPGRDCPACPAARGEHDGYGCERTGCPMPIHSPTLTPTRRTA